MAFLLAPGQLNVGDFEKTTDPIAIVLKSFTLKRKSEGLINKFAEPYVVSVAIDGGEAALPKIHFNALPFPNVRKGDTITFDGQGHLIYGPKHPGAFVAYSILFMEDDSDNRKLGEIVEEVITSKVIELGAAALLAAVPTAGTATNIILQLIDFVAKQLKKDKDDQLFRREGTFLRDTEPPFDVLRSFQGGNDFVDCTVSVLPLNVSNSLGAQVKEINLLI